MLEFHEAANLFPIDDEHIDELAADIKANGQSRDLAGAAVGVSGSLIDYATTVMKYAEPEVIRAVEQGRVAVSTAAKIAQEPPDVQREEAQKPRRKEPAKAGEKGDKKNKIKPLVVPPVVNQPTMGRKPVEPEILPLNQLHEDYIKAEKNMDAVVASNSPSVIDTREAYAALRTAIHRLIQSFIKEHGNEQHSDII